MKSLSRLHDHEDPIPYDFTAEGQLILDAAQTLRHTLSRYAEAEKEGVLPIDTFKPDTFNPEDTFKPGVREMVSAMRKSGFDMLYVDDLLDEFEDISERGCRAFELHFFAGLPPERIALLMRIPERLASRDVTVAKAWLIERLKQLSQPSAG